MINLEVDSPPVKCLAVPQNPLHIDRLVEAARRASPRSRIGNDLGDTIESPTLRPEMFLQERYAADMVVMNVGGNDEFDVPHPIIVVQLVDMMLDEAQGLHAVVIVAEMEMPHRDQTVTTGTIMGEIRRPMTAVRHGKFGRLSPSAARVPSTHDRSVTDSATKIELCSAPCHRSVRKNS